jgi:hypothetical protein
MPKKSVEVVAMPVVEVVPEPKKVRKPRAKKEVEVIAEPVEVVKPRKPRVYKKKEKELS